MYIHIIQATYTHHFELTLLIFRLSLPVFSAAYLKSFYMRCIFSRINLLILCYALFIWLAKSNDFLISSEVFQSIFSQWIYITGLLGVKVSTVLQFLFWFFILWIRTLRSSSLFFFSSSVSFCVDGSRSSVFFV